MKLAFLHIPKTGGISVERAVERSVEGLTTCAEYQPEEFRGKSYADIPGLDFYKGHFQFDFLTSVPKDYIRAVLVRPPIDQVLSMCNHIAERQAHKLHTKVQCKSISDILGASNANHNMLSKYLLGHDRYQEICLDSEKSRLARSDAAVDAVRENLKTVDVIGSTNQLGRFVKELGEKAGVEIKPPLKENAKKHNTYAKDALNDEDKAALEKATWVDRPVFRMIWTEFLEQKSADTSS